MFIIKDYKDLERNVGKELGVSEYLKITQNMINRFADVTYDHQWIHVDQEKAEQESPYKTTIAHGYLILSLLPYLYSRILEVQNVKSMINYSIESLKFNQPVAVNSEVRARLILLSVTNLRGIVKVEFKTILEIKDSHKNAFEAPIIYLLSFKEDKN